MSNRVYLVPTKFVDTHDGTETFGYRIFDDEDQDYVNHWDSIPKGDMEVLAQAIEEGGNSLLDYVREFKTGLFIGDNWYDWDDIKGIWEELADAEY